MTAPDPPTNVRGVADVSNTFIIVQWDAPAQPVTTYNCMRISDSHIVTSGGTSVNDIVDISSGHQHYKVSATYGTETSAYSAPSAGITPYVAPDPIPSPPALSFSRDGVDVVISWLEVPYETHGYELYGTKTGTYGAPKYSGTGLTWTNPSTSLETWTYYAISKGDSGNSAPSAILTVSPTSIASPVLGYSVNGNDVTLSWNTVANATSYTLYGKVTGGSYSVIPSTGNTYIDSSHRSSSWTYKVTATDGIFTSGDSNEIVVALLPDVPTGFDAIISGTLNLLSWSAAPGALSYNVYRKNTPNGNFSVLPGMPIVTNSFSDINESTTHYYVITSYNNIGESAQSLQKECQIVNTGTESLKLFLSSSSNVRTIGLTWNPPTDMSLVFAYQIFRGLDNATPTLLATIPNTAAYDDVTNILFGREYTYYIKYSLKLDSGGGSEFVNLSGGSKSIATIVELPPPTNVISTKGYDVVSVEGLNVNKLNILTTWDTIITGTSYNIYETIVNIDLHGVITTSIIKTTTECLPGATIGYFLAQDTDIHPMSGTNYQEPYSYRQYRVSANHLWGETSLQLSITPQGVSDILTYSAPSIPQWSTPNGISMGTTGSEITLSWIKPERDGGFPIIGYFIYMKYSEVFSGTEYPLDIPDPNDPDNPTEVFFMHPISFHEEEPITSYMDYGVYTDPYANIGLVDEYWYRYIISAYNEFGESITLEVDNAYIQAILLPSAPQNFTMVSNPTAVILNWTPPISQGCSPISEYVIYRSGTMDIFTEIGRVPKNTIETEPYSYTDTTATVGGFRYYIVAVNLSGEGDSSIVLSFGNAKVITVPNITNLIYNGNFINGVDTEGNPTGTEFWDVVTSTDIITHYSTLTGSIILDIPNDSNGNYRSISLVQKITLLNPVDDHIFYVSAMCGNLSGNGGFVLSAYETYDPNNLNQNNITADPSIYRLNDAHPNPRTSLKISANKELNILISFSGRDKTTNPPSMSGYVSNVFVIDLTAQFGAEHAANLTTYDMDSMIRALNTPFFDNVYIMDWYATSTPSLPNPWYNILPFGGMKTEVVTPPDTTVINIDDIWSDYWVSTNSDDKYILLSSGLENTPTSIKSCNDYVIGIHSLYYLYKPRVTNESVISSAICTRPAINGHIYYMSGTAIANYNSVIYNGVEAKIISGGHEAINTIGRGNTPSRFSNIITSEDTTITISLNTISPNIPIPGTIDAYFDSVMLIDLTDTFGTGSEPSLTAMDTLVELMSGTPIEYSTTKGYWVEKPTTSIISFSEIAITYENEEQHINLEWTEATTKDGYISGYEIFRGSSDTDLAHRGFVLGSETLVWSDTTTEIATLFYYTVKAVSQSTYGVNSEPIYITTTAYATVPTSFAAVVNVERTISLTWVAPNINAPILYYNLYRTSVLNTEPSLYKTKLGATDILYVDNAVEPNNTYYYKISAVTAMGEGDKTILLTVATPITNTQISGFDAHFDIPNVNLSWNVWAAGSVEYDIYKSYNGQYRVCLTTIFAGAPLTYTDTNPYVHPNGLQYSIIARGHWGNSSETFAIPTMPTKVSAPRNFTAINISDNQNTISWTAPKFNEDIDRYNLYYSTGTLAPDTLIPAASSSPYTHTVTGGVTYNYVVAAHNSLGEGPRTGIRSVTVPIAPNIPLSLTVNSLAGIPVLSWTEPAYILGGDATSYNIYMSTSDDITVASTPIASVDASVLEASHIYATVGVHYYYAVGAVGVSGLMSILSKCDAIASTSTKFLSIENKVQNGGFDIDWLGYGGWIPDSKNNVSIVNAPADMSYEKSLRIAEGRVTQNIIINKGNTILAICLASKSRGTENPALVLRNEDGVIKEYAYITGSTVKRLYLVYNIMNADNNNINIDMIAKNGEL